MDTKNLDKNKKEMMPEMDHDKPVQHIRDIHSEECLEQPATNEEVQEAVIEINPDCNSMDSRG